VPGTVARWLPLVAGVGVTAGAALLTLTAMAHRRATRWPGTVPPTGPGAIVVLGVPGTNPALRAVQRWRVDLALDLWKTGRWERVIFTGGPIRSPRSEAAEMAAMAVDRGLDERAVVLDERSSSTWENVLEASHLVGEAVVVAIASDAAHASRARTYWLDQRGTASPALILADRHGLLDHWWLRVPATAVELVHRASRRTRQRFLPNPPPGAGQLADADPPTHRKRGQ
jgi:vancomycin permeability regulator SanA